MEARRQARKFAVQATFQYFFSEEKISNILDEFSGYRKGLKENKFQKYDEKFFLSIVKGVDENRLDIGKLVESNLSEEWELNRIDLTMKSIICLAVFELNFFNKIPFKVIINEYVSIARMYFDDKDIGFINGILDSIARKVRKINKEK